MLTQTESRFTYLFIVLILIELLCVSIPQLASFHYFSKPALLISLLIFFYSQSSWMSTKPRLIILSALTFSLLGDLLLMFVEQSASYFMLGLVAFLIAHIFYILIFLRNRNPKLKPYGLTLGVILYAVLFFFVVKDGLGNLFPAVLLYMMIILIMLLTAYLRKGTAKPLSYILVCIGAILFVISDSILALNKFYKPWDFAGLFIMLTYALAQYFIVIGLLKQR